MRGRKPDAPELRLVKGNKRVRGLAAADPVKPAEGAPVMPARFDATHARKWRQVLQCMRDMGTLGREVGDLVRIYVEACVEAELARAKVAEEGTIVLAPRTGVPMHNMHRAIARQAEATILKVGVELGLSPGSRSRIPGKKIAPKKNAFAEIG